eukprot:g26644.t1
MQISLFGFITACAWLPLLLSSLPRHAIAIYRLQNVTLEPGWWQYGAEAASSSHPTLNCSLHDVYFYGHTHVNGVNNQLLQLTSTILHVLSSSRGVLVLSEVVVHRLAPFFDIDKVFAGWLCTCPRSQIPPNATVVEETNGLAYFNEKKSPQDWIVIARILHKLYANPLPTKRDELRKFPLDSPASPAAQYVGVHMRKLESSCVVILVHGNFYVNQVGTGFPPQLICEMNETYVDAMLARCQYFLGQKKDWHNPAELPMFLAHDGQQPLAAFQRAYPTVELWPRRPADGAIFLDQLALMQADYFIGNAASTTTLVIAAVRWAELTQRKIWPASTTNIIYPPLQCLRALTKLQWLALDEYELCQDNSLSFLSYLSNLQNLLLRQWRQIAETDLRRIASSPLIVDLTLDSCD